jgi:hypothetical protein
MVVEFLGDSLLNFFAARVVGGTGREISKLSPYQGRRWYYKGETPAKKRVILKSLYKPLKLMINTVTIKSGYKPYSGAFAQVHRRRLQGP